MSGQPPATLKSGAPHVAPLPDWAEALSTVEVPAPLGSGQNVRHRKAWVPPVALFWPRPRARPARLRMAGPILP